MANTKGYPVPDINVNDYNLTNILNELKCWCMQWKGQINAVYNNELTLVEQVEQLFYAVKQTVDSEINLTSAFNELQRFVNDYFNDINVQELVNNSIQELLNSGELDNILLNLKYLPSKYFILNECDGIFTEEKVNVLLSEIPDYSTVVFNDFNYNFTNLNIVKPVYITCFNSTLSGKFTINSDHVHFDKCHFSNITDLLFDVLKSRWFTVTNCFFNNVENVLYCGNQLNTGETDELFHKIAMVRFTNNTMDNVGLILNCQYNTNTTLDTSPVENRWMRNSDFTFNENTCNVVTRGVFSGYVDGFECSNNYFFTSSIYTEMKHFINCNIGNYFIITNNQFFESNDYAIYLNVCRSCIISNCSFGQCANGIFLDTNKQNKEARICISNCSFFGMVKYAFYSEYNQIFLSITGCVSDAECKIYSSAWHANIGPFITSETDGNIRLFGLGEGILSTNKYMQHFKDIPLSSTPYNVKYTNSRLSGVLTITIYNKSRSEMTTIICGVSINNYLYGGVTYLKELANIGTPGYSVTFNKDTSTIEITSETNNTCDIYIELPAHNITLY